MSLRSLIDVLQACGPAEWGSGGDSLKLTVTNGGVSFQTLRGLEEDGVYARQLAHPGNAALQAGYANGLPGEIPEGGTLCLAIPRTASANVVARNLQDLLSLGKTAWQAPTAYLLIEEEQSGQVFCFTGPGSLSGAPAPITRYHDTIKLWGILKGLAEHTSETNSLLFFGLRRLEIQPRLQARDLSEEIAVNEIAAFISNPDGQRTRSEIFRAVLSEFLRDQQPDRAYAYLLRASRLFARRLDEGLAVYLAEHSPGKLEEAAVAKRLALAEKLEKIIGGIEVKSLTIPAAILLAVKEVKFGEGVTVLNAIIFASAFLYLVAMFVAHSSQNAMLELLRATINKTVKEIKEQGLVGNEVLETFQSLQRRRRNSAIGSWFMFGFSCLPLAAVAVTAFLATNPINHGIGIPAGVSRSIAMTSVINGTQSVIPTPTNALIPKPDTVVEQ
jgi:hypothetical protein